VKATLIRALVNLLPLHSCRRLSEEKYHITYTGMLSAMGVLTFLRCCLLSAGRLHKLVLTWIPQLITRMQSKCLWNIYTPQHIRHQRIGALRSRMCFIQECTSLLSVSEWKIQKNEAFRQLAAILVGTPKSTGDLGRDSWTYSRPIRLSSATNLNMIEGNTITESNNR
jgi:hypothetical protein